MTTRPLHRWGLTLFIAVFILAPGFAQDEDDLDDGPVGIAQANGVLSEERLMDVAIHVFTPGLPQNEHAKEDQGIYAAVRKSESRFIPVRIMETLQSTGYWGAVRVVPKNINGSELTMTGEINKSDGFKMSIDILVVDATGKRWLKKRYKQKADPTAYRTGPEILVRKDPYQNLYNRIANDMLAELRRKLTSDLIEIREVSRMRFAADLAPDAFGDYVKRSGNRRVKWKLRKKPAEADPMMDRLAMIRERDAMLVDTLTTHYLTFQEEMAESYHSWQKFSHQEIMAAKRIKRKARTQALLGVLAIVGAAYMDGDSPSSSAARDLAVIGGSQLIAHGIQKGQEAQIHNEALRELAASLDADIEPMLIELQGNTHELTGSAEAQYRAWRKILREIFNNEMGLPVDPNLSSAQESQ